MLGSAACSAPHDRRGKGASGQAAALRWSGLRFAPTALCCSDFRPRRGTHNARCARCVQTAAASQMLIRAARGGRKPCAARRSRGALQPARTRLCRHAWFSPASTTFGSARQAVPGGGDFCGDEQHRAGLGARSAHQQLTRRGCSSGVSAANVASSAARARTEQRSGVGAKRRPPQHEPPPGTACRAALTDRVIEWLRTME